MRARFSRLLVRADPERRAGARGARSRRPSRTLETVLDRAGWYLDYFVDEFENVVAEENYIQDSSQLLPSFSPVSGGRGGVAPAALAGGHARARAIAICARISCWSSRPRPQRWCRSATCIEVDGVVGPRSRSAARQAVPEPRRPTRWRRPNSIREEGARYNLGNMRSTLGNPVLALGVLQQSYQPRFRFSLGKEDRSFGPGVAVVDYKEVASPAMIRGEAGRDLSGARPPLDRRRHRPRAQDRAAGRAAGGPRGRHDDVPGRGASRASRCRSRCASSTRSPTATASTRSPPTAASAASTSAPNEDIQHAARDDDRPVDRHDARRAAARALHDGQRLDRKPDATTTRLLHDVEITRPFLLGQHEVTQQEWRTVMGTSPSHFGDLRTAVPGRERHVRRRAAVPRRS